LRKQLKDTDVALLRAQQIFRDDADIIQVDARFRQKINADQDRALRALERAWAAGPRGSGTVIPIAQMYDAQSRPSDSFTVLKAAPARNQNDKQAHQAKAMHYLSRHKFENSVVEDHLRQRFSAEDCNFEARYNLAQFLFSWAT
jgi:thioredoxin-like negative regulator of GroEL